MNLATPVVRRLARLFYLPLTITPGMNQSAQHARGTGADPNSGDSGSLLEPSAEAALLLGRRRYHARGGVVYFSHQGTGPVSTTPTAGLTFNSPAGPSSSSTKRNTGTVVHRHDGLVHLPHHNIELVSTTPTINSIFHYNAGPSSGIMQGTVSHRYGELGDSPHQNVPAASTAPAFDPTVNSVTCPPSSIAQGNTELVRSPSEHIPTISTIRPTFNSITGLSSGVMQMDVETASHSGGGSVYPHDNPFFPFSPPIDANAEQTTLVPERATEVFAPFTHSADPLPGPSSSSHQLTAIRGRSFRTSWTGADLASLGHAPTLHTGDPPISPTTPTSTGSGHQRRRSRSSHTTGQGIPQMLGEMRDVIGSLAMSVDGLKDVVSDLRAGQNPGPGSTPVRGSGRGNDSRGRRGRVNASRGVRGGVGRGERSEGGPIGDDRTADADDESQGDEDPGERKDYKLRVSFIVHVQQLWD